MTIMNKICFDPQGKNPLDGNFISIYDEKDNRFHYFVHRLKGFKKNPFYNAKYQLFLRHRNRKCKGTTKRKNVGLLYQPKERRLGLIG